MGAKGRGGEGHIPRVKCATSGLSTSNTMRHLPPAIARSRSSPSLRISCKIDFSQLLMFKKLTKKDGQMMTNLDGQNLMVK
jgi:hypothetical protein